MSFFKDNAEVVTVVNPVVLPPKPDGSWGGIHPAAERFRDNAEQVIKATSGKALMWSLLKPDEEWITPGNAFLIYTPVGYAMHGGSPTVLPLLIVASEKGPLLARGITNHIKAKNDLAVLDLAVRAAEEKHHGPTGITFRSDRMAFPRRLSKAYWRLREFCADNPPAVGG